jgi:hypothetical protein
VVFHAYPVSGEDGAAWVQVVILIRKCHGNDKDLDSRLVIAENEDGVRVGRKLLSRK